MNPIIIPTLLLALGLFWIGGNWLPAGSTTRQKVLLWAAGFLAAIPGLLMPAYYLHLFDQSAWFYEFRSLPFSELSAAGAGLLAGRLSRTRAVRCVLWRWLLASVLLAGVLAPHLKPILAPLSDGAFSDRWEDGVCLQSTPSSCGPASVATMLGLLGIRETEETIARESFAYRGGTENWYLARALRRRGVVVSYRVCPAVPSQLPVPCIAGVDLAGIGHFVAIVGETPDTYTIADPLVGLREYGKGDVRERYPFTGFFMVVAEPAGG